MEETKWWILQEEAEKRVEKSTKLFFFFFFLYPYSSYSFFSLFFFFCCCHGNRPMEEDAIFSQYQFPDGTPPSPIDKTTPTAATISDDEPRRCRWSRASLFLLFLLSDKSTSNCPLDDGGFRINRQWQGQFSQQCQCCCSFV